MANIAIITAAGIGRRIGAGFNKVFLMIKDMPVILRTLKLFNDAANIDKIIITARKEEIDQIREIVDYNKLSKVNEIVEGGKERQDSVYNGLKSVKNAKDDDIILVHNGANPFIDQNTINLCIINTTFDTAVAAGFKCRDTIKEADEKGYVKKTLDREKLWQIQTPQCFTYKMGMEAFKKAYEDGFYGTDDVMLIERLGNKVKIVECPYENIKITLSNDLDFGLQLLSNARIGFGMDSHRFERDSLKKLVLGGIIIDEPGFEANSDGDVLLHALFNAISQGLGEMSIGHYADDMCKNGITESREYLKVILKIMAERGYKLGNVGIMLEGKKPRIFKYHDAIKESLSKILNIDKSMIGITATSGEDLTDFGRGLGMQCFCIVSLNKV
ncbi:MAG: 2-C-methyl-D-erythritol 4-phosphate cytidylyltransferase [Spirochaetes bacterium]|nr:2-C-methyl-D-erythritol 4-phosphate cytidylyltransferase [Spirochaetota bacterium]